MTPCDRYRALTNPRRVALIGASSNPSRLTARPQRFLAAHGYGGEVLPVNANADEVLGVPAWPSLQSIEGDIDHACILLGTAAATEAVVQCAEARVPVVSVLADGFADAGPAGVERQRRLSEIARRTDMLLLGPNSMGVADTRSGFVCTTNAAFAAPQLRSGRIGVISQSGSLIGTLLSRGDALGVGFSTLVSVGNEAVADVARLGELLLEDRGTDALVLFLETLRDAGALARFASRARAAATPVFAYVVGRSLEGQAQSVSHTGALVGGIAALDAYLRHHGIVRVDVLEALIEAPAAVVSAAVVSAAVVSAAVASAAVASAAAASAAAASAAASASPGGARPAAVTVVTTTGGGGAMVVDQLSVRGVRVAGPSPAARAALAQRGIACADNKLVDVTLTGATYDTMKAVVSTLMADPATGLVLVAIGSSAQFNPELAVRPLLDAQAEAPQGAAPLLAFPLPEAPASLALLREGGVASFRTLESCAESVAALFRSQVAMMRADGPGEIDPLPQGAVDALARLRSPSPDEWQAMDVVEAAGVPCPPRVRYGPGEALPFGFPVAAKLLAPGLAHKTEADAVRLDLQDEVALEQAVQDMTLATPERAAAPAVNGVLVVPMCHGVGELIVGLTRDPRVGPVVSVGLGGVFAELLAAALLAAAQPGVVTRPAPVGAREAARMLDEVPGIEVLRGYRGRPAGDLVAAADAVAALSRLALDPRVREAEVNPLLVRRCGPGPGQARGRGEGVVALDALLRLDPPEASRL